jgi:hypothetical protein
MEDKGTNWPTASIVLWGTFGPKTAEGRRYHQHFRVCLPLMVVGFLVNQLPGAGEVLGVLLAGSACAGITWGFRRYLRSLDELARRIQLESIAWTYLTGLAVAPMLSGIMAAYNLRPFQSLFGSMSPFVCVLLIEQVRTLWLYKVSRKY